MEKSNQTQPDASTVSTSKQAVETGQPIDDVNSALAEEEKRVNALRVRGHRGVYMYCKTIVGVTHPLVIKKERERSMKPNPTRQPHQRPNRRCSLAHLSSTRGSLNPLWWKPVYRCLRPDKLATYPYKQARGAIRQSPATFYLPRSQPNKLYKPAAQRARPKVNLLIFLTRPIHSSQFSRTGIHG
jgi:hypothetical protein